MYWLHLCVTAPLWGMVSAQIFLISALSVVNFCIAVVGLLKRRVPLVQLGAALATSLFSAVLFAALLAGGIYIIREYTAFGEGRGQSGVYWLFVVLSVWFMAEQVAAKIKKQWRNCTVEGSLEADMFASRYGR